MVKHRLPSRLKSKPSLLATFDQKRPRWLKPPSRFPLRAKAAEFPAYRDIFMNLGYKANYFQLVASSSLRG
jgi:hypothetical protein